MAQRDSHMHKIFRLTLLLLLLGAATGALAPQATVAQTYPSWPI